MISDFIERAACYGKPIMWFFPEGKHARPSRTETPGAYARGKTICRGCPVRTECLDFALQMERVSRDGRYGLWGGLDPDERHRLHRERTRQRKETDGTQA